jgi:propanol-preferring alcohol dehydrogenase
MRAAVLERYSKPLVIQDIAEPVPAEGESILKVKAVGLCGTDIKITGGAFSHVELPLVPGHEVAGEVVSTTASGPDVGTRVACYVYETCGECSWCKAGRTTICPNRVRIGFERPGGLADYIAVSNKCLIPIADSLSYEQAAVAMDAVVSPWMALHHRGRIQAGEKLVIAGVGGLGMHALQVARAAGLEVGVIDPAQDHLDLALKLGAEIAVVPDEIDSLHAWADPGADIALESSGSRAGFDAAVNSIQRGGRVVCVGYYPGLEYGLDSSRLVLEELEILGSVASSKKAAEEALEAVGQGAIVPQIAERKPFEQVNEALDSLRGGDVLGRVVVDVDPA